MKDKLRAYLAKTKGFTLVELLVVIAIIAILVLLVIIALDPIERIRDANDRNAQNAVRQAGSALEVCITKELSRQPPGDPFGAATCVVPAFLQSEGYITNVASLTGVTLTVSATPNLCALHDNAGGHGPGNDVTWNSDDTITSDPEVAAGTCH